MIESLPAQGTLVDEVVSLSHLFENNTGSPVTYNLRLDGAASVFALPEPGALVSLGSGGLLLLALARRRRALHGA